MIEKGDWRCCLHQLPVRRDNLRSDLMRAALYACQLGVGNARPQLLFLFAVQQDAHGVAGCQ
jgi:hypothetical protein